MRRASTGDGPFHETIGFADSTARERTILSILTTGLQASEILDVSERIDHAANDSERSWPPISGLYGSVVVTVAYVRRNRV